MLITDINGCVPLSKGSSHNEFGESSDPLPFGVGGPDGRIEILIKSLKSRRKRLPGPIRAILVTGAALHTGLSKQHLWSSKEIVAQIERL